ncbi:hypothetical protein NBRC116592_11780 [Colwellia sp. KU-HH00111]|uniref:hypothetical protein n=1 Tax=Colwellia sp. KU-HH00111 TaxID=3127652 RepID=UPI00310C51C9
MKENYSELIKINFIADGKVHYLNIGNNTFFYILLQKPIITFSFGTLKDRNIIHSYHNRVFNSDHEWLAYLRSILRESLVEKKILKRRDKLKSIEDKYALIKKSLE